MEKRVELSRIIIDDEKQEQLIVLKEKEGNRLLPIVIGISEAAAIKLKLSKFKPPRPLTHDLIKSIFDTLNIKLEKIVIDKLVDNTFFAKLYLITENGEKRIVDARPSDSIAIALRTQSPIFVEEDVLDKSSLKGI